MAKSNEPQTLASYITQRYENWREDRKPLQDRWEESRENFLGIFNETRLKWKQKEGQDWHSRTHIAVTKQKVTAGVAMVLDIVLRAGKLPFTLAQSEWDKLSFSETPPELEQEAEHDVEQMILVMEQQLRESHADRVLIKTVWSGGEYGEGYVKLITKDVVRNGWERVPMVEGMDLSGLPPELQWRWIPTKSKQTGLAIDARPIWNIFRDLEDEDRITCGGYIDRDFVDLAELSKCMKKPGFIKPAIERLLKKFGNEVPTMETEDTNSLAPNIRDIKNRKRTIRWLEFWGRVPRNFADQLEEEIKLMKNDKGDSLTVPSVAVEEQEPGDEVEIMAVVVDNEVIKYVKTNPINRPIYRWVWDENLDETGGTGVADNVKDTQRMLDGAIRAFEDNKKLSANVISVVKRRMIKKMPKALAPGSTLEVTDEVDDVRKAYQNIVIPDIGATLLDAIALAEKYSDDDSMIPRVTQGAPTKGAETAFEIAQRLEKAGKYIGGVIRNLDEGIIEPVVQAFYDRNMKDPELQYGKGNYIAKSLGFSTFQNQVTKVAALRQWLELIMSNPELSKDYDLSAIAEEMGRDLNLDPNDFKKSDIQKQQEAEAIQAQQEQEQMMAEEASQQAKAMSDAQISKTQAEAQAAIIRAQADTEKVKNERVSTIGRLENEKQKSAQEAARIQAQAAEDRAKRFAEESTANLRQKYQP